MSKRDDALRNLLKSAGVVTGPDKYRKNSAPTSPKESKQTDEDPPLIKRGQGRVPKNKANDYIEDR